MHCVRVKATISILCTYIVKLNNDGFIGRPVVDHAADKEIEGSGNNLCARESAEKLIPLNKYTKQKIIIQQKGFGDA